MKSKTSVKNQSTIATRKLFTTDSVITQDGTTIGYRQLGRGPGLVLLHGSMSSGYNHLQLANALSDAFTVYIPDRRDRGLSGPYSEDYSIRKDLEDLDAMLTQTGAHNVFGVSSGGIISLRAALALQAIHRVAIYEPPLFADDSVPTAVLRRFDKEMAKGDEAAALITAMKGAQMGPPIFNAIPRWLSEPLTKMAMAQDDKNVNDGYIPMRTLAPTLHYDFQLIVEISGKLESFKAVRAEVLLLGGSKSPAYLKTALDTLEKILPHAKRIEFRGLGHEASWNTDRGGQPEQVAQELRRFFA
jgi:pimeloyl-ACP methyl ester carboxylesterase